MPRTSQAPLTPPERPTVAPGRGVILTAEQRHAWHHYRIAETDYRWRTAPKRTGSDRLRRRELEKARWWNLKGHLAAFHGRRNAVVAVGATYEAVADRHAGLYQ